VKEGRKGADRKGEKGRRGENKKRGTYTEWGKSASQLNLGGMDTPGKIIWLSSWRRSMT
jgi:hypothetical protein